METKTEVSSILQANLEAIKPDGGLNLYAWVYGFYVGEKLKDIVEEVRR